MKKTILGLSFLLIGCATIPASISDINDSSLKVRAAITTTTESINAEAQRGCAIYGKKAQAVSKKCLDTYCHNKDYLFACGDEEALLED